MRKYSDKEKADYYRNKSIEYSKLNNQMINYSVKEIDKVGNIFVAKDAIKAEKLNKVLSSEEYRQNDYRSNYYANRSFGMSHDEAKKESSKTIKRKVAISNNDLIKLKLITR